MKNWFIIIFFLVVHHSFSQVVSIQGCYESVDKGYNSYGQDYFCFNPDNSSFKLLRMTDVEDEYGQGRFRLTNDSLILEFEEYIEEENVFEQIKQVPGQQKVIYEFEIVDKKERFPMPGVNVFMSGKKGVTSTDANGIARLEIDATSLNRADTLVISFIGYTSEWIPVQLEKGNHFKIKVLLTSGYSYYQQGDRLSYKVMNHFKGEFSLMIFNNEVEFKKIGKNRFDKAWRNSIFNQIK